MTWRDIVRLLLRLLLGRKRTTKLNARVRIFLAAPFSRRSPMAVNRVLAHAGAKVASISLSPTRDDGSPGQLDGPASYSEAPQYTLVIAADGLSADVIASGITGDTDIVISADGDLGKGVETISQTVSFEFVAVGVPLTTHLNATVTVTDPAPDAPVAEQAA